MKSWRKAKGFFPLFKVCCRHSELMFQRIWYYHRCFTILHFIGVLTTLLLHTLGLFIFTPVFLYHHCQTTGKCTHDQLPDNQVLPWVKNIFQCCNIWSAFQIVCMHTSQMSKFSLRSVFKRWWLHSRKKSLTSQNSFDPNDFGMPEVCFGKWVNRKLGDR